MIFLLAYLNVHYLILLSMVHESLNMHILWIHLENGLFFCNQTFRSSIASWCWNWHLPIERISWHD